MFFYNISYSQSVDTAAFRKDIQAVLKKHNINTTPFVISLNQQGGQTAFTITNVYTGVKQRHVTDPDVLAQIKKLKIPNDTSILITILAPEDNETKNLCNEIGNLLYNNNFKHIKYIPTSIHGVGQGKIFGEYDTLNKVYELSVTEAPNTKRQF